MSYDPYEMSGVLAPYGESPHLFAIMNNPCQDGLCLLLMVTSIKEGRKYDETCVLGQGDHPFIKHASCIVYRLAYTPRATHIGNTVNKGLFIKKEDWLASIFNKIAAGLYNSDQTPRGMAKYAAANNI